MKTNDFKERYERIQESDSFKGAYVGRSLGNNEDTECPIMSRKDFHAFMDAYDKAYRKEERVNEAMCVIWDEGQGQFSPFYISEYRGPLEMLFCFIFGIDYDKRDSEIDFYYECLERPGKDHWTEADGTPHQITDIDDFYDYLTYNATK